jgi:hypothetical protein
MERKSLVLSKVSSFRKDEVLNQVKALVKFGTLLVSAGYSYSYFLAAKRIIQDGIRSGMLRAYSSISTQGFVVNWFVSGPSFDLLSYVFQNLVLPFLSILTASTAIFYFMRKASPHFMVVKALASLIVLVMGLSVIPSFFNSVQYSSLVSIEATKPGLTETVNFSISLNVEVIRASNDTTASPENCSKTSLYTINGTSP